MDKLETLRNESRGFCEIKKKHDSPTALRLFGRENHASFLTKLYILLILKSNKGDPPPTAERSVSRGDGKPLFVNLIIA